MRNWCCIDCVAKEVERLEKELAQKKQENSDWQRWLQDSEDQVVAAQQQVKTLREALEKIGEYGEYEIRRMVEAALSLITSSAEEAVFEPDGRNPGVGRARR